MMDKYTKIRNTVLGAVLLIGCICFVLTLNITQNKKEESLTEMSHTDYFRDFQLKGLDGELLTQEDIRANKVTVINGWAPWCSPCTSEMPDLEKLSREYEGRGLKIVGIVADYDGKKESMADISEYDTQIRNVIASTGITYPSLVADEAFTNVLGKSIVGYPTTWAVDSEGNIIGCVTNKKSAQEWREYFDRWLKTSEGEK